VVNQELASRDLEVVDHHRLLLMADLLHHTTVVHQRHRQTIQLLLLMDSDLNSLRNKAEPALVPALIRNTNIDNRGMHQPGARARPVVRMDLDFGLEWALVVSSVTF